MTAVAGRETDKVVRVWRTMSRRERRKTPLPCLQGHVACVFHVEQRRRLVRFWRTAILIRCAFCGF
jgi:hypothetical protein